MKLILTIGFTIISLIGLSQWEKIASGTDSEWTHFKIDFINQDTGIVIGAHSTAAEPLNKYYALITHDGGETFDTMMYQPYTKAFFDVHFFNDTTAFLLSKTCCNQRIEILKSVDAGQTWTTICDSVTSGGTNQYTMQFISLDEAIVTAPGWTFYTTDGGVNWARTNYYSGNRGSYKYGDTIAIVGGAKVDFSDDLFANYDSILFTNYNIDYISSSNTILNNNFIAIPGSGVDGQTFGYPNFNFGKFALFNFSNNKVLEVDFPSIHNFMDIAYTNDRIFLASWVTQTLDDLILMSDNGGESWYRSEIIDNDGFTSATIESIDFINDTVGYAVHRSTIYKTTNAGGPLGQQVGVLVQGASSISENIQVFELNIYPNPTNNIINIEAPVSSNLQLYNVSGKLIKSYTQTSSKTQVDLSNIPSGIYILTVLNDAGSTTRKIVIN